MTIKTRILFPLAVLAASGLAAFAAPLPQAPGKTAPAELYRLRNGLRVVLAEDGSLPLVSVVVAYGAGTVRERSGEEGLAYLMENLMFQGSENVSPLQHINFIQKVGGTFNANTTFDKAVFYETLPSNQLALALWLESDRMKSLSSNPFIFARKREELVAEQRRRLAMEPYLESFAIFDNLLYPDYAYGHPLIQRGEELTTLTEEDVTGFHDAYYVPNNAVLVVVGNIQSARARELVARYFETIPQGPPVPPLPPPSFQQDGEEVMTMREALLPYPGFHFGYRFHPLQTGDKYTVKILEYILLHGGLSRLNQRLLRKDRTAYYLSGMLEDRGGVPALRVFVTNNNTVMAERCQKALADEIDRLRGNLVPEQELNRAKNLFKKDYLKTQATFVDRAMFLADAAFAGVPVDAGDAELAKYMKVAAPALMTLVNRLCIPRNKAVLNLGAR